MDPIGYMEHPPFIYNGKILFIPQNWTSKLDPGGSNLPPQGLAYQIRKRLENGDMRNFDAKMRHVCFTNIYQLTETTTTTTKKTASNNINPHETNATVGGFIFFEFFIPIWGRWTHFDDHIFSDGLVQPPTSNGFVPNFNVQH